MGLPERFLLSRFQDEMREVLSCQGGFPGLSRGGPYLRAQGAKNRPGRAWIHSPRARNTVILNLQRSISRSPTPSPSVHREAVVSFRVSFQRWSSVSCSEKSRARFPWFLALKGGGLEYETPPALQREPRGSKHRCTDRLLETPNLPRNTSFWAVPEKQLQTGSW